MNKNEMKQKIEDLENREKELLKKIEKLKKENEDDSLEKVLITIRDNLEFALETGQIGTWEIDFKNKSLYVDDRLHRILGYKIGIFNDNMDEWLKIHHPMDTKDMEKRLRALGYIS